MIRYIRRHWVGIGLFAYTWIVILADNWFATDALLWGLVLWYLDERGDRITAQRRYKILETAIGSLTAEVAAHNRRGRPIDAASVPLYDHERTTR